MIHITPDQERIVKNILHSLVPTHQAFIFGSRANGTPKPFSDLDIALQGTEPLSLATIASLREAFTASDLPYRVDLVDLLTVTPEFHTHIQQTMIPLV